MKRYTEEEIRQEFVKYLIEFQGLDTNDAQIAASSLFTPERYSCFINYEYEGDEVIDGVNYGKYSNTTDFTMFRTFYEDAPSFVYYEYKDKDGISFYSFEKP